MTRSYEYRHTVTFQETNLLGNVYYVEFLKWQGACREHFLMDHARTVVDEFDSGFVLSTVRCSCNYGLELFAFDSILVRMRLAKVMWNRIVLQFEYLRERDDGTTEEVARGEQEIACMQRDGDGTVDRDIPPVLLEALEPYRVDP